MTTTTRTGTFDEGTRITDALYQMPGLDLGCGSAAHTKHLKGMTFVDLIWRDGAPENMVEMDLLETPKLFSGEKFGVTYMLDSVEHLHKEPALKLLKELEEISERIVIFTPLGDLWLGMEEGPSGHHSGWTPEEFEALGYTTWSWPVFHNFGDGKTHGAFWAWKDVGMNTQTVEMIAHAAGVPIE